MAHNVQTVILAAFVADSLALGVHWVYDTKAIIHRYGRVTSLIKPELTDFHQGKKAGDLTHYGDQMLWLLQHVVETHGFDPQKFISTWQNTMHSYTGYLDQATRQTLAALDSGHPQLQSGSASTDIAGATRIAPLLLLHKDPSALIHNARMQAQLTHNSPLVLGAAELLARACLLVMEDLSPTLALEQAAQATGDLTLVDLVRQGLAGQDQDSLTAIKNWGQSCGVTAALPGAVQVVARHGQDLRQALEENTLAGGDNAARGMFIATLLGSSPQTQIPEQWLEALNCKNQVGELLAAWS